MKLLGTANTKTLKGESQGYVTYIMHLAPHDAAVPGKSVCPWASPACIAACLNTAGRGVFDSIQAARARKTRWFFEDRAAFMAALAREVAAAVRSAKRKGLRLAIRLNGTSDLPFERYPVNGAASIMAAFPDVQFYDYTKSPQRAAASVGPDWPSNYHLTFSRSETNELDARALLSRGVSVAAVFDRVPQSWAGRAVIAGDETDLRFLDPRGAVVGLTPKGRARRDTSGFVIRGECHEKFQA